MFHLTLATLRDTERLGRALADSMCAASCRHLLMYGDMGSGKTTLVRALVARLPGGQGAEVSSPSFTLCNHYPTRPPVVHCDLYRGCGVPDDLLEAFDDGRALVLVEWAEQLSHADRPHDFLDIRWQTCETTRLVTLSATGPAATRALARLSAIWDGSS